MQDTSKLFPALIAVLVVGGYPTLGQAKNSPQANTKTVQGNFNGDNHLDLAVTVPGTDQGRVAVYYGRGSGKFGSKPSLLLGGSAPGELFGAAIAAGDFDKDGYDELVVGAPGAKHDTGQIYLFKGSRAGLSSSAMTIDQDTDHVRGSLHKWK